MNKKYKQTPSQTLGPFFSYGLVPEQYNYRFPSMADNYLFQNSSPEKERIIIKGQVFDGNGDIVSDALIEITQDHTLDGFGRFGTGTERDNRFIFHTIKPESKNGQAPYINVTIMMRGLLSHVFTRIYFPEEADANVTDKVLNLIPKERRKTLIAERKEIGGQIVYQFDIYMQGENETVFFDA